jgi:hypothetical protein
LPVGVIPRLGVIQTRLGVPLTVNYSYNP